MTWDEETGKAHVEYYRKFLVEYEQVLDLAEGTEFEEFYRDTVKRAKVMLDKEIEHQKIMKESHELHEGRMKM